jgi:excisionase family DNA binding protein
MVQDKKDAENNLEMEKYVTIRTVCEHFAISEAFVRKMLKHGLPHIRAGVEYRLRLSEVERWMKQE